MERHCLVLGGARSGKTGFAERLTLRNGTTPAYLVTTAQRDSDMRERIAAHQLGGMRYTVIEEPIELCHALIKASKNHDVIFVDCVTLWISNMLKLNNDVANAVSELCATLVELKGTKVILVSDEVGQGVEPDTAMARTFRDLAGSAHQRLAEVCEDVYFVVAGMPMTIKGKPAGLS
ncbi:bifunctional adenosylcobinamide kinase/adenosylcobinamide-phosphate guanylyltransferase [Devosia sp. MC532]|nr:bifunctional adenosylcobinamide kinase/adenosylcobinamide-phosphate guanylyltransferase [Devosia sp. MC521]MBJ7577527.1 bifunctional adenosylcobinamide kinase/adenosylcobinamide-phosphate guanylyltransferase [Devosia sp. MC532]MBK1794567.1 bifunctional adenosylcobinamide kinase/adenosylcobinamide-phosphate guanylyltransferase [Devosia sp. WQ 349K1]QMW64440.1 bifunctional adenosylcobinamide kinase/adenosylcobinamide-phosphate guanylyltransferase [Devosia sp. MC521]